MPRKRLTENNSKVASTQLLLRPAATFDAQVRAPYRHPCLRRVGASCLRRHGARWQWGEHFFQAFRQFREKKKNNGGQKKLQPSSCCSPLPRSPRRRERRTVINVRVVSARCVCIDTGRGGSGEKFFLAAAWLAAWYDFLKLRATSRTLRQPSFWEPQPGTFITSIF